MKIANVSVDRPVLISMVMVALILLGLVALPLLPVDLYPNMDIPIAIVSVSWTGHSPSVVEQQVTKPMESVMSTVSDVSEVDSMSQNGTSRVILHFNYGTDLNQAVANMRDKVNQVTGSLPSDAGAPQIMRIDPNATPIMTVALSGSTDVEQLKQLSDDVVTPRLQQANGVSSVTVNGGKTREIDVVVNPDRLSNYGLAITNIIQALQSDNLQGDAGLVNKGNEQIDLHVNGQFATPGDVLNVPVKLPSGGYIKISDVAQVNDAYQDVTENAIYNGIPCVTMDIMKVSGGNTVQVAKNVRDILPAINRSLSQGIKLSVVSDSSTFITDSINTVVDHTLLGGIFSLVILWLFLRRVRTTVVIAIVIPISVMSTFAALYFANQTINTISLGGLALGLGSLVDFAVVVIESIFRHRETGLSAPEAAKSGTAEVGTAVMASALSQISVFAPIVFVQGLASQIFMPMALAVVFSHLAALVGALTLVPMLSAKLMRGKSFLSNDEEQGSRWNPANKFSQGIEKLKNHYGKLLRWAIGHRKIVLLATVLMLAGSLSLLPLVGFELQPQLDQGQYTVKISLAQGTKLAVTNQITNQVLQQINKMPETASVYTVVGSSGGSFISQNATNSASITVNLKDVTQRKRSVFDVIEALRQKVALIPGAQINIQAAEQSMGGNGGADIQVVLQGNDLNVLNQLGDLVANQMQQVPGTRGVQNTADKTTPEYDINIDRVRAAQYGITTQQILNTLEADYNGTKGTSYIAGSTSVDVVVKLPEDYTRNYANINNISVLSSSGAQIPLSDLATIKPSVGPATIRRQNQMNQITIQCSVFGRSVGQVQNDIQTKLNQLTLPSGYTWQFGGQAKDMTSSFNSLGLAMPLSIVLMYMVMAGQFESLFSPFIIMFSLPPTFVGVMLGLTLMGQPISVNALIGIVMLIGIVVNNAIVLVDYTNQLRKKGLSTREALYQAGPVRLRPILMTTCTTVLAMLPLMLGHGQGSESEAPMATTVVFGLTVSTMVTLVLVPVMFTIFDDLAQKLRSRKKPAADVQPNLPG